MSEITALADAWWTGSIDLEKALEDGIDAAIIGALVNAGLQMFIYLVRSFAKQDRQLARGQEEPDSTQESTSPDRSTWRSGTSLALRICGWIAMLCSAGVDAVVGGKHIVLAIGTTIAVILLVAASLLQDQHRRRASASVSLSQVTGDYVLYLRSFREDGAPDFQNVIAGTYQTHEEALVAALRPIGQVFAPGQPYERWPEAGATRVYLRARGWKYEVVTLISRAKLCVVSLAATSAIRWELSQCLARVEPHRLVLILPPNHKFVCDICEYLSRILPEGIPHYRPHRAFVTFDEHWRPKLLPVLGGFLSRISMSRTEILQQALAPLLASYGSRTSARCDRARPVRRAYSRTESSTSDANGTEM